MEVGVFTLSAAGWQLTRRAVSLSGLDRQVFTLFFLWCAAHPALDKKSETCVCHLCFAPSAMVSESLVHVACTSC